jgi:arylsulfatase A
MQKTSPHLPVLSILPVLALVLGFAGLLSAQPDPRPNVILILADDLGYQDLSSYGHPEIRTPAIDGIGRDGIKLTNFHAGASICTPSRMALLTGAYPVRLGWTEGVAGYKMGSRDGLSPDALTLAEIFQSEGYRTAISGKWHIGNLPETRPHNQGFDETYFIPLSNNQTTKILRGNEVVEDPFENRLLTEKFTSEAIRFIRANANSPVFLYLPYSAPHFPVEPHPEWEGKSSFGVYGDVVEEMDFRIGEILATLEELDIADNTIVIFTSDNGPQKGEEARAFPFRGAKWSALEGGTRVPCVIRWTGKIQKDRESDIPVSALDLLPTLCRAAGIDWKSKSAGKPPIDGSDILDSLLAVDRDFQAKELLYWEGFSPAPRAIRADGWKLFFDRKFAVEGPGTELMTPAQAEKIARLVESTEAGAPLLFNLSADPGETTDLSAKFPDKVQELRTKAAAMIKDLDASEKLEIARP